MTTPESITTEFQLSKMLDFLMPVSSYVSIPVSDTEQLGTPFAVRMTCEIMSKVTDIEEGNVPAAAH